MTKQKNVCRIKNIKWKQEDWNSLGTECGEKIPPKKYINGSSQEIKKDIQYWEW
jgi:hypothetical protein